MKSFRSSGYLFVSYEGEMTRWLVGGLGHNGRAYVYRYEYDYVMGEGDLSHGTRMDEAMRGFLRDRGIDTDTVDWKPIYRRGDEGDHAVIRVSNNSRLGRYVLIEK